MSEDLKDSDIRIDTFRRGINTVDSHVRLTHMPTGISASCNEHRSQYRNKKAGLIELAKLVAAHKEEKMAKFADSDIEVDPTEIPRTAVATRGDVGGPVDIEQVGDGSVPFTKMENAPSFWADSPSFEIDDETAQRLYDMGQSEEEYGEPYENEIPDVLEGHVIQLVQEKLPEPDWKEGALALAQGGAQTYKDRSLLLGRLESVQNLFVWSIGGRRHFPVEHIADLEKLFASWGSGPLWIEAASEEE